MNDLILKDFVDRKALEKIQLARLQDTVTRLYENVEFYHKAFDEKGVKPRDLVTLADLAKFPTTIKTDLRDHYPFGLLAVPQKDIVRIHASSGTTGKPTVVCYTKKDIDIWAETMARALICGGATEDDIIHDAMEPEMLPRLDATRPHWPPEVWERGDYVMDAEGRIVRGWKVALKDDPGKPAVGCLKICQARGGWYMRRRLRARLAEAPYKARFYDVTGTGIAECHNPRHPLTLRQAVSARREMLGIPGREFALVTGTEEGLECFVPECDYLEGNFSAYTWRVDGGRNMWKTYETSPDVMKYAIDPTTRYPFWEMVFHDCVSSYWYWTDYNNRFLDTWWQRDALNAITGTAPMYLFTPETFAAQKEKIAESVKVAARTARETADSLLLEYRWLSADRLVQQSRFSGGFTVTVNFSDNHRTLADGRTLAPHEVLFGESTLSKDNK